MLFIRAGPNTDALPSQPSHPNEDYRRNAELVKMQKEIKKEREREKGVTVSMLVCLWVCHLVFYSFLERKWSLHINVRKSSDRTNDELDILFYFILN